MNARLLPLVLLNAVFLLGAFGCGDEEGGGGGCGEAPPKKEQSSGGGGYGQAPKNGGGAAAPELVTQDRRGNVPKPYQRPGAAKDEAADKPAETAAPAETAKAEAPKGPKGVTVTKRKVSGVADRVELVCEIITASPDGKCSSSKNYAEIKKRCCPNGLVEQCRTQPGGVVIVGRGCP